jgi:hypothetical protein
MADRSIALTNTFAEWRTEFNELGVDVGDIGTLNAAFTATDLVGAANEVKSDFATLSGFSIAMAVAL